MGTRTGAEQQSPGHCVQGTLAFASREGRDWLKCSHSHGLFRHATGQRVLLARRCLPARRLLTGNHVGSHPHPCPCPCPCPCLTASLPHCPTALTAPGRAAPSPCTAPSYSRVPDWGQDWALTYVREVALTFRGSAVLEAGRALFEEGAHAFFLVLGGKEAVKEPPLEAQTF